MGTNWCAAVDSLRHSNNSDFSTFNTFIDCVSHRAIIHNIVLVSIIYLLNFHNNHFPSGSVLRPICCQNRVPCLYRPVDPRWLWCLRQQPCSDCRGAMEGVRDMGILKTQS